MSEENGNEQFGLVPYLRKIMVDWQLSTDQLAQVTHVTVADLDRYLQMSRTELNALPSVPAGLESAMPLVSVYKNLNRMVATYEKQNEWLVTPHDLFEGNKPIEVMAMSPQHLMWVSYTLESAAREQGLIQ
jgi:hypothetical protein